MRETVEAVCVLSRVMAVFSCSADVLNSARLAYGVYCCAGLWKAQARGLFAQPAAHQISAQRNGPNDAITITIVPNKGGAASVTDRPAVDLGFAPRSLGKREGHQRVLAASAE